MGSGIEGIYLMPFARTAVMEYLIPSPGHWGEPAGTGNKVNGDAKGLV
jgi:hypothetical protein